MRTRWVAAAATVSTICLLIGLVSSMHLQGTVQAQTPQYTSEDDYGYGYLTPEQREGRNTWYFWTGGNQKFWVKMAELTEGNGNLLAYVDSRLHGRRFATLGAITQPGCPAATGPDKHGLWMDVCDQPPVPGIDGAPSGITGLRFDNPDFVSANWNADTHLKNPGTMQPPYLIGMTCGFCHIGFNPLNPPDNPELPKWANLAGAIGNQFWEEGRLFNLRMPPTDFRWHVGNRQPAGTSDTSRFATDHINNPNAINSIFNLEFRPTQIEQMADGSMAPGHHILKEGADSIGIAGASLRVSVNIGMCSDYWITLHDPVMGRTPQKPFDIAYARANCADWRATDARMTNAEAFLKTMRPIRLSDAPGGSVLDRNFLSDDRRYPVSMLGTNIARAVATNATAWKELIKQVHQESDCKYIIQLSHGGRQRDVPGIEFEKGLSSTDRPDPLHGFECERMTLAQVGEVAKAFGAAAVRARAAGADGVELHGANGYLITQFLSSAINDRKDDYGGSLNNRARVLLDIVREIRAAVGRDFHLQMKISAVEFNDALDDDEAKGNTLEDSVQVCKWLEEAGVDAIHVSSGSYFPHPKNPAGELPIDELKKTYDTLVSSGLLTFRNYLFFRGRLTGDIFKRRWDRARGDMKNVEGMNLPNAHRIKQAVGIPVLCTGGFQTAAVIEQALVDGLCDAVTVARPLIANNNLVQMFANGQGRPARPCTYCNKCLVNAVENPLGCYEPERFSSRDEMVREIMTVFDPPPFAS